MATVKRLRKRVELEPRLYEAIQVYAESRALSVSSALHELVLEGFDHKGLSLTMVLEQGAQTNRRDGKR
jgi:hypothetical protein